MNQLVPVQTWTPRRYSQEDRLRIRHTFCEECSDAEADQFIATCERTGLDPWARQIYVRMQWDSAKGRKVMQVGITIDGQRLVAKRTAQYQGQTKPEWCGEDGIWKEVWLQAGPPAACRVGVYCAGFIEPLPAIALYSEYAQKTREGKITQMWRDKAAGMLWKCAEALGLRKAFPQELSGLYTDDEMMQAERVSDRPTRHRDAITGEPLRSLAAPTTTPPHDPETGEVLEDGIPTFLDRRDSAAAPQSAPTAVADTPAPSPQPGPSENGAGDSEEETVIFQYEELLEKAAKRGTKVLAEYWKQVPKKYHKQLEEMKNRCKELAAMADRDIKEAVQ